MSRPLLLTLPEHLRARRAAQRRDWLLPVAASALAGACLFAGGVLLTPINDIRRERQLVIDPATVKGLPPELTLLGKLGTFRALAIDWASIRADRLKEEGKTYEALQLHLTVCRLAPRFPTVWQNAAWNMAYNISVMKYTPEERWQWVQNGISLLRDEGLVYNPKAVGLYRELSWIYWHKIGDFLDDEHLNYKRALAVEMERVLGPPVPYVSDQEYFDWFRKIVQAPRDLEAFIRDDPDVGRLVTKLRVVGLAPDDSLLDFVARHLRPDLQARELVKDQLEPDPVLAQRLEIVTEPKEAETLERLLAAVRSKVLRERYRFDLDWMMSLMENEYGPLDWRNAFSHSLYWSSHGDKVTRGRLGANLADVVNTARFVFFSLQQLINRGRIILFPNFDDAFSSYIELTPDTRYIPYLHATYLRLGKEHFGNDPRFIEGTPGPNYMNGFVNAMHTWIELLYLDGGENNLRMAENFYSWLRENNPHPDGSTQEQYMKTVEAFVMDELLSRLQTYKAANAIIRQFVRRGLKEMSLGLSQSAMQNLKRARLCYDYWMEDTKVDINERRKLQPIRVVFRDEIISYLQLQEIAPLFKARLWRALPLEQRQLAYDSLQSYFTHLCDSQKPAWDVEKAFAEPPGMEEFRRQEIETRGKPRREDVEQGERSKY
jgi:hypothetical protein